MLAIVSRHYILLYASLANIALLRFDTCLFYILCSVGWLEMYISLSVANVVSNIRSCD